ncbi:MAG: hypothetical protein QOG91_567 [Candidatus Parcubacteria bacterium]|jgi:hypothetical protein|nr:hypothetical protein [Candidatus Parcubacteria bacterium]
MKAKSKDKGWLLLYLFSGGMDFIQFVIIEVILIWFLGLGAAINEVLDPIVGVILASWIQFGKKVSLISRPNRLLSMVGTEAAAALTGGIAQLWILDVWYIHNDVKKEVAAEKESEDQDRSVELRSEEPLNQNGRSPARRPPPLYHNGRREAQEARTIV